MIPRSHGFTIVELITVMIVLGVLSAIAIPRLTGDTSISGNVYRQEVLSALRYAQKTAVSHRRLVCATLAAQSVTLQIATANPAAACGTTLASPDGTSYVSRDSAVSASGNLVGTTLFFQPSGLITTTGAGIVEVADTITITSQGTIRIDGSTGYVE